MSWPHRRLKTNSKSNSNSGSNTNSKTYSTYSSPYHRHHARSRGTDESPSCGYYGPGGTSSPLIPLGVCGNYKVGDVDKSMLYECDHSVLAMKIYDGQWCSDLEMSTMHM
eukprot:170309_1